MLEEIKKGIIGKDSYRVNCKMFISVIGKKYYTGFEDQKSGKVFEIEERKNGSEAMHALVTDAKDFT